MRPAPAPDIPISWAARSGVVLWLVQPLYLAAELATAARVTAPYSLAGNTISDLGATTCTAVAYPFGPVPVCSPWHQLVNGSFIAFGLFLALGAVLIRRLLPPGPVATSAVVLWVISGLTSVGTGLVPLDQNLELHNLVTLPILVTQPLALLTLALALRTRRLLAWSTLTMGLFSLAGTSAFLALESAALGGLYERLVLWPAVLWTPVVAVAVARARRNDETARHGGATIQAAASTQAWR